MSAHSLEPTYLNLLYAIANIANWDRDPDQWSPDQESDGADILRDALAQFYFPQNLPEDRAPWEWSFLRLKDEIDLVVPYATGTVGIAANVGGSIVTLTGGTWPAWAAAGDLWVNGERYSVKSRSSNSVVLLDNVSVTVTAGAEYSLICHEYALPDDYGSMSPDAFIYRRDQATCVSTIPVIGETALRRKDQALNGTGTPIYAALVPVVATSTQSTRWAATFWPIPSEALTVEYTYKASPPALNGTTHVYPYGGPAHALTIRASVEDIAHQRINQSTDKHPAFLEQLRRSIRLDQKRGQVTTLGKGAKSLVPTSSFEEMLRCANSEAPSFNLNFG